MLPVLVLLLLISCNDFPERSRIEQVRLPRPLTGFIEAHSIAHSKEMVHFYEYGGEKDSHLYRHQR